MTSLLAVGRYILGDAIGGGGMASVHLGRMGGAAGFSRVIAIKRVRPEEARDPELVTMLADEARVVSRIKHLNVVPVIDVVHAQGELLLVMEYVHGVTVSELVRQAHQQEVRVPLAIIVRLVLDVLAGLEAAHQATSPRGAPLGIVHRDISPQNLIVGVDGVLRVVDFGIAKAAGKLLLTREGEIRGKLAYMAPEQLRAAPLDARTDLYAVGVVLWELVAGRRLFAERTLASLAEVVRDVGTKPLPSACVRADIPPAIDEVLRVALSPDPTSRFPDAEAMARAVERVHPAATARDVAMFVRTIAGGTLAQRSDLVTALELLSGVHQVRTAAVAAPDARAPAPTVTLNAIAPEALTAATHALVPAALPNPAPPPPPPPVVVQRTVPMPARVERPQGRRPALLAAAALVILGLIAVVVGVFFFTAKRGGRRRRPKGP